MTPSLADVLRHRLHDLAATIGELTRLAEDADLLPAARLLLAVDVCAAMLARHLNDLSTRRHDRTANGQPTVALTQT